MAPRSGYIRIPIVKEASSCVVFNNPEAVRKHMADTLDLAQETMNVLTLNTKYRLIRRHLIGLGIVDSCLVHPREIFRPAILDASSSIVVCHNHPSGDPTPSAEDLRVTRQLIEAGKIIGIDVLDHVIIGRNDPGYVSLREAGLCCFS